MLRLLMMQLISKRRAQLQTYAGKGLLCGEKSTVVDLDEILGVDF